MAERKPPSTGTTRDRARRINSLHNHVDKMVAEQDKKRLEISSEISSLTKEQQKIMQKINVERGEFTTETAKAYDGVVKSLGKTIQNLSVGVKNITTDTAKATASSISQYGKAIGEDINVNKQNTVAMALAKTTPLFGYFAAKFMETDVFQSSAKKIKEKVSKTLASAGESIGNIFKKKEKVEMGVPPKLARGGYVKKGGLVEVHPAEVVTPVDKIMKRMDESRKEDRVHMARVMSRTFIRELKRSPMQDTSFQERLLKSVDELKVAMVGTSSRLRIAWQRMLLKHPMFRGLMMFGEVMQKAVVSPFRALFGLRGGFSNDVRRATRTTNTFEQQVNLLAIIYSKGMTYLRDIAKFTQVTAEALVGEPVSPVATKTYTIFGKVKEFMTSRGLKGMKESAFDSFVTSLDLDRTALADAGIRGFGDLLNPAVLLKNAGITKENLRGKVREGPAGAQQMYDKAEDIAMKRAFEVEQRFAQLRGRYGPKMQSGFEGLHTKAAEMQVKAGEMELAAEWFARRMWKEYAPKAEKGFDKVKGKLGEAQVKGGEAQLAAEWYARSMWQKYGPRTKAGLEAAKETGAKAKNWGKDKFTDTKDWSSRVVSELYRIRKAEEDREDREGPHSPSMAENIATTTKKSSKLARFARLIWRNVRYIWKNIKRTALAAKRRFKREYKTSYEAAKKQAEIAKAARETAKATTESAKDGKKRAKEMKGWIPMIMGFFSNILGKFGAVGRTLKTLSGWFLGPFYKMFKFLGKGLTKLTRFFGKGIGKTLVGGAGKVGKAIGGVRGAWAGGGARAAGRFALGGLAKMGVKGAAVLTGGVGGMLIGGAMSLWDMAVAMVTNPEGFVGNFLVRGLAAFLGGRDTGAAGAKSGALKGASLGAAIGAVGGPIGIAIGGAIGGIAGGILGFVGGGRLSQVIKDQLGAISEIAKGIWEIIKFPFQFIREASKIIWSIFSFLGRKFFESVDDVLSSIPIVDEVWKATKHVASEIISAFGRLFSSIGNFFKNLFSDGETTDMVKEGIAIFLSPVSNLVYVLKKIGTAIDGWLESVPVIGRFYKMSKKAIKSVRSGDLSASFQRALEGQAPLLTDAQKEKMSAKEIAAAYAKEETSRRKSEEDALRKHAESVNKATEESTKSRNQVTVASTNVITANSSTNIQQPFGSVYGGGSPYKSGSQQIADRLAMGNIF